ncbi:MULTISPECIES: GNAT family N-acetyltransferase [Actinomycetes]|uniref:GNAT family N-acetyltransferase n=1 Tax=Actinomycetes TaxID=1760 RepID=UPI0034026531
MAVTIRPRREEDIPVLAAILIRVHELDGYPIEGVADPEGWLRHDSELRSWTAVEDTTPIGQITLTIGAPSDDAARAWYEHTHGDVQFLAIPARLFVAPEHRGTGAGRLLMKTAIEFARARKLAIAFDVMLKDRAAISLYESLGAERVAEIVHRAAPNIEEPAAVYLIPDGPNSAAT